MTSFFVRRRVRKLTLNLVHLVVHSINVPHVVSFESGTSVWFCKQPNFYVHPLNMSRNCVATASEIKKCIVGIGGMTNGGKSTLSQSLHQQIPNSCVIAQDSYFKDESEVPEDSHGFKQYDLLDALHMDTMMSDIDSWRRDPLRFLRQRTLKPSDEQLFVLIVEGFLIFNYRPLNLLFDKRYFIEIPYDVCKRRRSSRVYTPPDPPGYFDGHVWPMYLKNRIEMEDAAPGIVFLDGQKPKEELLSGVRDDVFKEIERLRDWNAFVL